MASIMMLTTPASAHVEVGSDKASPGAQNVTLTFHVPNEHAPATTVGIRIVLPAGHPLIGVRASAQHGFTATVKTRHQPTAIPGPDGPVVDVASEVDFTNGHISGTDEPAFTISVRQLPSDAATLTFKTLQTYSTGDIVRWIEIAADGAPEPEHPAPVLSLGARGVATASTTGPGVTAASAAHSASSGGATGLLVAVGVAATAALAWIGSAGHARRRKRRARCSPA
jgi:uncharacterized protein YcnI